MSGSGGGDKNTLHDSAMGWGILSGVLACIFWLFWYFYEYQVKNAFRWLRYGEMWLVSWFVDDNYTVTWKGQPINFKDQMPIIHDSRPDQLNGYYTLVAALPMEALKIPFIIILCLMGLWAYSNGPATQFRRKLGLDALLGVQAKTFPVIQPFVRFNPSSVKPRPPGSPVPEKLPAFAEALAPEEWLVYNHIPMPERVIDENECYRAFAKQLGPRWQGTKKLAPHRQVLLAAFALKAVRKRNEADALLGRIAACWSEKDSLKLSKDRKLVSDARRILRDESLSKNMIAKCNQHAFEATVMLRGLQTAREEGGVLAPAQFVWLRAYDRELWYPLNNLGRQAFHMEALGAMAHFKAEKMTQRPIPKPKVDNAIFSIVGFMKSVRARPIPQLERAGKK